MCVLVLRQGLMYQANLEFSLAEDDLELVILLPLPHKCYVYRDIPCLLVPDPPCPPHSQKKSKNIMFFSNFRDLKC